MISIISKTPSSIEQLRQQYKKEEQQKAGLKQTSAIGSIRAEYRSIYDIKPNEVLNNNPTRSKSLLGQFTKPKSLDQKILKWGSGYSEEIGKQVLRIPGRSFKYESVVKIYIQLLPHIKAQFNQIFDDFNQQIEIFSQTQQDQWITVVYINRKATCYIPNRIAVNMYQSSGDRLLKTFKACVTVLDNLQFSKLIQICQSLSTLVSIHISPVMLLSQLIYFYYLYEPKYPSIKPLRMTKNMRPNSIWYINQNTGTMNNQTTFFFRIYDFTGLSLSCPYMKLASYADFQKMFSQIKISKNAKMQQYIQYLNKVGQKMKQHQSNLKKQANYVQLILKENFKDNNNQLRQQITQNIPNQVVRAIAYFSKKATQTVLKSQAQINQLALVSKQINQHDQIQKIQVNQLVQDAIQLFRSKLLQLNSLQAWDASVLYGYPTQIALQFIRLQVLRRYSLVALYLKVQDTILFLNYLKSQQKSKQSIEQFIETAHYQYIQALNQYINNSNLKLNVVLQKGKRLLRQQQLQNQSIELAQNIFSQVGQLGSIVKQQNQQNTADLALINSQLIQNSMYLTSFSKQLDQKLLQQHNQWQISIKNVFQQQSSQIRSLMNQFQQKYQLDFTGMMRMVTGYHQDISNALQQMSNITYQIGQMNLTITNIQKKIDQNLILNQNNAQEIMLKLKQIQESNFQEIQQQRMDKLAVLSNNVNKMQSVESSIIDKISQIPRTLKNQIYPQIKKDLTQIINFSSESAQNIKKYAIQINNNIQNMSISTLANKIQQLNNMGNQIAVYPKSISDILTSSNSILIQKLNQLNEYIQQNMVNILQTNQKQFTTWAQRFKRTSQNSITQYDTLNNQIYNRQINSMKGIQQNLAKIRQSMVQLDVAKTIEQLKKATQEFRNLEQRRGGTIQIANLDRLTGIFGNVFLDVAKSFVKIMIKDTQFMDRFSKDLFKAYNLSPTQQQEILDQIKKNYQAKRIPILTALIGKTNNLGFKAQIISQLNKLKVNSNQNFYDRQINN